MDERTLTRFIVFTGYALMIILAYSLGYNSRKEEICKQYKEHENVNVLIEVSKKWLDGQ